MKTRTIITIMAMATLIGTSAMAADYSGYSTEELSNMRGTMRNASQEEKNAFRKEWQSRMRSDSSYEGTGKGSRDQHQNQHQYRYRHNNSGQSDYGQMQGGGRGGYGGGGRGMHGGGGRGRR